MRRTMERNRWETAIRCLEIAVHPNTSDEELIAAVNGFRRTAGGTSLSRIFREFASQPSDGVRAAANAGHLHARLDQLNQENRELRRKIAEIEDSCAAAQRHLHEAEQRAQGLREELIEAEHNAATAEQRLAEFQGAYGRISDGLHGENIDLRRALEAARRDMAQPIHEPVPPFPSILNAARQRQAQTPPAAAASVADRPWTA
jgi:septal ring factor EnvC (AmiA/AmiB activator)